MDKNNYDFEELSFYEDEEENLPDEYQFEVMPVNCPYYRSCEDNMRMMPPERPKGGPVPPGHGHNMPSMPPGPPPKYTPSKSNVKGPSTKAVDSGAIRFCRYKYTYIWQTNGRSYWAYITFVGRNSISGFRWQYNHWVYFGIDLRRIDYFQC